MPRKNLLKNYINEYKKIAKINGFSAGLKYAIGEIRPYRRIKDEMIRAIKKFPHKIIRPPLFEIFTRSKIIQATPEQLLMQESNISLSLSLSLEAGCGKAVEEYNNLIKHKNRTVEFSHVSNMARFLYYIMRIKKPELVIETGAAFGLSTFFILKAMSENNFGSLISTDIFSDAGEVVPDYLKNRWEFILLKKDSKNSFKKFMDGIDKIDVFIHDSEHSYDWQMLEYTTSWDHIKNSGLLISDDIDNSYAFLDYSKRNQLEFNSFFNIGSMAGIVLKTQNCR